MRCHGIKYHWLIISIWYVTVCVLTSVTAEYFCFQCCVYNEMVLMLKGDCFYQNTPLFSNHSITQTIIFNFLKVFVFAHFKHVTTLAFLTRVLFNIWTLGFGQTHQPHSVLKKPKKSCNTRLVEWGRELVSSHSSRRRHSCVHASPSTVGEKYILLGWWWWQCRTVL